MSDGTKQAARSADLRSPDLWKSSVAFYPRFSPPGDATKTRDAK